MPEPTSLVSIRIPPRTPGTGKPPLLVLMHGIGSDEHDLAGLATHVDGRFDIRSARGPIRLGPGQFAWFEVSTAADGSRRINPAQAESSRLTVLRFVDEALAADGADPDRVYLAGFSQGGIMAFAVSLSEPERIAGAVAMSSRILPEMEPRHAGADRLTGLPLLVVHGTRDQVIPIASGRASQALLSKVPVQLTYREFPMAHQITPESLDLFASWLTEHLDQPRRVATSESHP